MTISRWGQYQEWLYSPDVWGMCVRDDEGYAISSPTIKHVISYDLRIRQEVAKQMNEGIDWHTAMEAAKADTRLMQNAFLFPVSIVIVSKECKNVSAPNALVRHSRSSAAAKAVPALQPVKKVSEKNARKKAKALKDRVDADRFRAGGAPLAIEDRQRVDKQKGGKKGDGKGAPGPRPELPEGIIKIAKDGKGICHRHNRGTCNFAKCTFHHFCWWCESPRHSGAQCPTHPK